MIGDMLTSLKVPYYNSNCSKLNGSTSLFGEAELNDNTLYSAEMAQALHFQKNVPLSTVRPSESEQSVSPK